MRWLFLAFLVAAQPICYAQDDALILLNNPSFEDQAAPSRPPLSWFFCGSRDESPPDIQPNGIFGPTPPPLHGSTYLGMVARHNGTYESVGQRLSKPMKAGYCYRWSVKTLRSPHYISTSRDNPTTPTDYNNPLILRIWGGQTVCDRAELLSQSPPILDTTWQNLDFILQPNLDYSFLILEAYYYKRVGDQYNGNVMLDHAGPVLPIDCNSRQDLIAAETITLPTLNAITELEQWLGQTGPQIQFSPLYYNLLQHSYFQIAPEQYLTGNAALWQIITVMASYPDLQLQIGLPGVNRQQYNDRVTAILLEIRELGLSGYELDFVRVRKKKARDEWLNSDSNDPLWLRLQKK